MRDFSEFQQEYMGERRAVDEVFWAWAWYHVITERFDQTHPRHLWGMNAMSILRSARQICPGMDDVPFWVKEDALRFVEREVFKTRTNRR